MSKEKREQERTDVGAVNICVGHDDYSVIAQSREIKLLVDASTEGCDDCPDLRVGEHLVKA